MKTSRTSALTSVSIAVAVAACAMVATAFTLVPTPSMGKSSSAEVQQLPRVVVIGQVRRTAVEGVIDLPRVVVTGHVGRQQILVTQDDRVIAADPRFSRWS